MHLAIDGYGGDPEKLQDQMEIFALLDRFPAELGMRKIAPPFVFRYVGAKTEDWGVSGFVLIAESHISVHTFPEKGFVNIDIFSCKDFAVAPAVEEMKQAFGLQRVKTHLLWRGEEYPSEPAAARSLVEEERQAVAQSSRVAP